MPVVNLSVEECIAWLRAADDARFEGRQRLFDWLPTYHAERGNVPALLAEARAHIQAAASRRRRKEQSRVYERRGRKEQSRVYERRERINLVTWALCRAAARAISAERALRAVSGGVK